MESLYIMYKLKLSNNNVLYVKKIKNKNLLKVVVNIIYVLNVLKNQLETNNKISVLNVNKKIGLLQLIKNSINNILIKLIIYKIIEIEMIISFDFIY